MMNVNPPADKKLTLGDLENKTISEIWLMRKAIYAKYGKPFTTHELHAFFMGQPWYQPNEKYEQTALTANDLYNVDLLIKQEQKLHMSDYIFKDHVKQINFNNIYNAFQYPGFTKFEVDKLTQTGFVVLPTNCDQLFHIYEKNYSLGIPSFISVDAILQLYHLLFDMVLRSIESEFLINKLNIMLDQLISEFWIIGNHTTNQNIKSAIEFDLAYLGISQYFLKGGDITIQGSLKNIIEQEIYNCKNHRGWAESTLLNRMVDYSQYIPRGHYTISEQLQRYFLAMMWIGQAGIDLNTDKNLLSSVLLTHVLYTRTYNDQPLINLWQDIYEPTVFYLGVSVDIGPVELNKAMENVFPANLTIEQFDDYDKLITLKNYLSQPALSGHGPWGTHKEQFRLMGQRFIPDSYIFQRLTSFERTMPNCLEIMAAFGNSKASSLMLDNYKSSWQKMPDFPQKLNQLITENNQRTEQDWKQNLYYHWLYNLKSLFDIKDKDTLPFFMTTDGWDVKTLNTCLASWAELRHDTILYSTEVYATAGPIYQEKVKLWIPEPPKGFVEPNLEFYNRMLSLMYITQNGLQQRHMLNNRIEYISKEFISILKSLQNVSEKEIKKQVLNLEEYDEIQKMGVHLDFLTIRILSDGYGGWEQMEGPDKNMPVIADVLTTTTSALEVGVGKAHEIYVIVEIEGKLKLTRGAIFSYYEFTQPLTNRLTNEKWQEMLTQGNAPEQPDWINYISDQITPKGLKPLYKTDIHGILPSSKEPGWKIVNYEKDQ